MKYITGLINLIISLVVSTIIIYGINIIAGFAGADYKSIMPGYEGRLSDQEIWQVLAYIKAQWPILIRKQHTEAFSE